MLRPIASALTPTLLDHDLLHGIADVVPRKPTFVGTTWQPQPSGRIEDPRWRLAPGTGLTPSGPPSGRYTNMNFNTSDHDAARQITHAG